VKRLEDLKQFMSIATELTRRDGSTNVDEISDALGIDIEDGVAIAIYLDRIGWANCHVDTETKVWLTEVGYQKLAEWRTPVWKQWPNQHPWVMNILCAVIASLLTVLILKLWHLIN
jgi:hypothetical protein